MRWADLRRAPRCLVAAAALVATTGLTACASTEAVEPISDWVVVVQPFRSDTGAGAIGRFDVGFQADLVAELSDRRGVRARWPGSRELDAPDTGRTLFLRGLVRQRRGARLHVTLEYGPTSEIVWQNEYVLRAAATPQDLRGLLIREIARDVAGVVGRIPPA